MLFKIRSWKYVGLFAGDLIAADIGTICSSAVCQKRREKNSFKVKSHQLQFMAIPVTLT